MATPFAPIAGIAPIDGASLGTVSGTTATGPIQAPGIDFAGMLDKAQGAENAANQAATSVATGGNIDIATYTTLAAKAQLSVELAAAVRNRAVDSFNEIMRMQV